MFFRFWLFLFLVAKTRVTARSLIFFFYRSGSFSLGLDTFLSLELPITINKEVSINLHILFERLAGVNMVYWFIIDIDVGLLGLIVIELMLLLFVFVVGLLGGKGIFEKIVLARWLVLVSIRFLSRLFLEMSAHRYESK